MEQFKTRIIKSEHTRRVVLGIRRAKQEKLRTKRLNQMAFSLIVMMVLVVLFKDYDILPKRGQGDVLRQEMGISTVEAKSAPESVLKPSKPSVEEVKEEIIIQSAIYGVDTQFALDLAFCESRYDAWAKNTKSTARGVYQYLIGTWEVTESAKQGHERNDYKANIKEAMLDLSNGEEWRWAECLAIME